MSIGSSDISLNYVSAPSPDGLVQACFKNNVMKGKMFTYFSVTFNAGNWYAWYHDRITATALMPKKVKGK